ncbi:MAG: HD domain-containing phosphohydrolase, partial [Candidatus Sedimenticola sp. (ex Thyasira tokunagai)]
LTKEEFEQMKEHAAIGEETIKDAQERLEEVQMLDVAREIAGGHHEKWDGSGYPRGLQGEQIPLPARIMALADVYDALISRRPYKEPVPHSEVMDTILSGAGKHFDPEVVEVFVEESDAFLDCARKYAG